MNEVFYGRACKGFNSSARHTGGRDPQHNTSPQLHGEKEGAAAILVHVKNVMPAIDIATETQGTPVTVSVQPKQKMGPVTREDARHNNSVVGRMHDSGQNKSPLNNGGPKLVFSQRSSRPKDCPECSKSPAKVRCTHNSAGAHGHGKKTANHHDEYSSRVDQRGGKFRNSF